jgi:hypothetical protein
MVNRAQLGWAIPTNHLRAIAGAWHREMVHAAAEGVPLPSDEFLNARLREAGCHEGELSLWRARIRALRYSEIYESAALT